MNINQISSTFDNHINIKKVKEYFPDASSNNFDFTEVSQDEVKKEVLHLNVKKSPTSSSIPATVHLAKTLNLNPYIELGRMKG